MGNCLNKNRNEYKFFFDNCIQILCIASVDGYFIKVNKYFCDILNYKECELYDKNIVDYIHPDDVYDTQFVLNTLNEQNAISFINRYKINNTNQYKKLCWYATSTKGIIYAIATDVTDNAEIYNAVNMTFDGIAKIDNNRKFIYTNSLFNNTFCYDNEELIGKDWDIIIYSSDKTIANNKYNDALIHKQTCKDMLIKGITKDNRIVFLKYDLISTLDCCFVFIKDISDQKEFSKQIMKLEDAKCKAENTTKIKSEFVANISHEIRTPIGCVIGMASLLLSTPLNDDQKKKLDIIIDSAGSLLSIINNVLDLSKIEAGKLVCNDEIFNLKNLLTTIKNTFEFELLRKDIYIYLDVEENVPEEITCDKIKIRQVLINLINNSIKFTYKGGITINVSLKMNNIIFKVKDTGIGIQKDKLSIIFEPFEQLYNTNNSPDVGTGLGLTICKKMVELMKGEISIQSLINMGTTVSFSIPFKTIIDFDTEYIIVVEDNNINQMVIIEICKHLGYQNTLVYNNGLEVINDIQTIKLIKRGLIFMDLHMPKMNGYVCTEKLRQHNIELPIIALTANAMMNEKDKCLRLGMNDFLLKPVQIVEIQTIIKKYIVNNKDD